MNVAFEFLRTITADTVATALLGKDTLAIADWLWRAAPVDYVRSATAVKPDIDWAYTDGHGHTHRWHDGTLPTLVASNLQVDCDGSCGGVCGGEGYTTTQYHCVECEGLVEPGYVPDYQARTQGVRYSYGRESTRLTLRSNHYPNVLCNLDGKPIAVELRNGDETLSGRVWIEDVKGTRDWNGETVVCVAAFEPSGDAA